MRTALIAGAIVAALALLGGLYWLLSGDDEQIADADQSVVATDTQSELRAGADVAGPVAPTFDIVRVERDGTAVIAGRTEPGERVSVYAGDKLIGSAIADERGEWVIIITEPLPAGDQHITLRSQDADGKVRESEQVVVIAVPEREGVLPLVVMTEPGGRSRVLQEPDGVGDVGTLRLDTVDYDEKGDVILGGRAEPGARVQVYLNNDPIGTATADDEGEWTMKPEGAIPPGVYALRVDELDANGGVIARVEVPFERVPADIVLTGDGTVIIQPGNNLWTIARHLYGSGFQYTVIYQANRDQIRDPDLIYPGQVFSTPGAPS